MTCGPSSMRDVSSSKLNGGVVLSNGCAAPSTKMSIRFRGMVVTGLGVTVSVIGILASHPPGCGV